VGAHGLAAPQAPLDMGNAGTAMRLMMGLLAPQKFDSTLIGDASLMRRPMERVRRAAADDGSAHPDAPGPPPVEIRGTPNLRAIHYSLPVASAQVKSAVLLADSPPAVHAPDGAGALARSHERNARRLRVQLAREGRSIAMEGGQTLRGTAVRVPADSPRRVFLVAGCLAADRPLTPHQHRREPDAYRSHRAAAAHGGRTSACTPTAVPVGLTRSRSPTSRFTAAPCTASRCPRRSFRVDR